MLDQTFSIYNIRRLLTFDDIIKYDINVNSKEFKTLIETLDSRIGNRTYSMQSLKAKKGNINVIYSPASMEDDLALRKLNDNLKRLYKFKQANRLLIIKQVITLLKVTCPPKSDPF
jgi:hypothetical protein